LKESKKVVGLNPINIWWVLVGDIWIWISKKVKFGSKGEIAIFPISGTIVRDMVGEIILRRRLNNFQIKKSNKIWMRYSTPKSSFARSPFLV